MSLDPYSILGISVGADADEIKTAYRRLVRRLHPDSNHHNPGAAVQFQDITTAYELLTDPNRKQAYDQESHRRKHQSGLTLTVIPSKRTVRSLDETQVMYLLAEIQPESAAQQAQQRDVRLNLTLVLDRSNSMNGTRLERVKVAAHQIIDQLTAHDILSVVTFSDRADVIIPATTVKDKPALKAKISFIQAGGGTEIFQGLQAGVEQTQRFLAPRLVNHVILLTDGNTFGDEEQCLRLAKVATRQGICISAMGLGQEWNDAFLDELASTTGGTSEYITSSSAVVRFLNDHVKNLSNVFAERMQLSVAPDPDVRLESAFKLAPSPQPLPVDQGYIPLGSLQLQRPISVLLQFELPAKLQNGFRSVARVVSIGDILDNDLQKFQAVSDISIEVSENPTQEDPPLSILDALGKLTLYRMQERAQEALQRGDVPEATKRLEWLATRLLAIGENDLAQHAKQEAQRISATSQLSERGRKTLKYHTRYLLLGSGIEDGE